MCPSQEHLSAGSEAGAPDHGDTRGYTWALSEWGLAFVFLLCARDVSHIAAPIVE